MQINPQFPEHQHLNCPRCDSNNTKFCYYNNYNLSQPRHFCKNCKRYWTKGGILRNIPVGGGTRKITKRSSNPKKSHASPAPATSTSPTTTTSSSLTAQSQPKLESSGVGAVDLDGRVVELGSRFSSRSQSGGQFGNFINMEAGGAEQPNSDESGMIETSPNEIRSNSNDSVSCLGYGWPDLSIVMPGSQIPIVVPNLLPQSPIVGF